MDLTQRNDEDRCSRRTSITSHFHKHSDDDNLHAPYEYQQTPTIRRSQVVFSTTSSFTHHYYQATASQHVITRLIQLKQASKAYELGQNSVTLYSRSTII